MTDQIHIPPPRVTLFDMSRPGEEDSTLPLQFNPTEYKRKIQVNYSRLAPIGQPHEVLQYRGTSNQVITMSMFFLARGIGTATVCDDAKSWMESLCYPRRSVTTIKGGAPPDVLLVWPSDLTMTVKLMSVNESNERFFKVSANEHYKYCHWNCGKGRW